MTLGIPRFVLTGGPCGGKTTAREYLKEKLKNYGFTPFFVPEIPTEFILNGITPEILGVDQFQESLFEEILRRETSYLRMALKSSASKKVLFHDRGICDTLAYSNPDRFDYWIEKYGLHSRIRARDGRYDAIFHLVTAANGAESFYTLENNKARVEKTLEEAREKDALVLSAWNGHQHLHIIDNSTDFEGKMRRLLQRICHALGIPVPLEIERKFLIHPPRIGSLRVPFEIIVIEQAYLVSNDGKTERRVRKRTQRGDSMFVETAKQFVKPGVRIEREWPISESRYLHGLAYERAEDSAIILKKRFCFPYENQYFEMDCLVEPHKNLWLLEIELTEEQQEIKLPPFIDVIKEVTDDPSFSNRELARVR